MSDKNRFVKASELYHVSTGNRVRHPAHGCTDDELREAVSEVDA